MPQSESFAKCACQHCGGHIEFPLGGAGLKNDCPHCHQPTLLFLNQTPRVEVGCDCATRRRIYMGLGITAGLLAACAGAYFYFGPGNSQQAAIIPIRPAQISNASPVVSAPVAPPKPEPPPDPWHGLYPGKVTLEKT